MSCDCKCEHRFYICKHCGNLVGLIQGSGVPMICCGEEMSEIVPGSVDAAKEKHLPVISIAGDKVTVDVGSIPHPMEEKHYIQWIYLQTQSGGQRKCLKPGDAPQAVFALANDKPLKAYAYCNLHSLWVTEV